METVVVRRHSTDTPGGGPLSWSLGSYSVGFAGFKLGLLWAYNPNVSGAIPLPRTQKDTNFRKGSIRVFAFNEAVLGWWD